MYVGVYVSPSLLLCFIVLSILPPDNVFKNVDTFEFPDSDDTLWKGNDMGGGCVDDKADFASGSDSNIPSCK